MAETYLEQRRRWLNEDLAQMQIVAGNWESRKAELARQRAERLITQDEHDVNLKRGRLASQKAIYDHALKVGGRVKELLESNDARCADRYAEHYWAPDAVDGRAVDHWSELYRRRLAEAQTPDVVAKLIDEAERGTKEQAFALWRAQDVLRAHGDNRISMQSGRARNALARHLAHDPQYLEAVEKQNATIDAAAYGVGMLKQYAAGELGGTDPTAAPFGMRNPANTLGCVLDLFDTSGDGRVGYWDPNDLGLKPGDEGGDTITVQARSKHNTSPTIQVQKHVISEREQTGGPW